MAILPSGDWQARASRRRVRHRTIVDTRLVNTYPDSKVHGANMGTIWGRQDPGGPHVGPNNFAILVYNSWWCHNMKTFPTILALCERVPPVTGAFPQLRASDEELWCFLCCYMQRINKQSSCLWHWNLERNDAHVISDKQNVSETLSVPDTASYGGSEGFWYLPVSQENPSPFQLPNSTDLSSYLHLDRRAT